MSAAGIIINQSSPSSSGTIRVLLVNDHEVLLWGLEKLIGSNGPRMAVVATARTRHEALISAAALSPDIILLSLELGGNCMAESLPDLLAGNQSRAIVFAGAQNTDVLDLAVRRGARGILYKEASGEALLKAIEKIHHGELWFDAGTMNRVFGQLLAERSPSKPSPVNQRHGCLTARERVIVSATVEHGGTANYALAERLFISEHTLRNHLTSIYRKLDVSNRLEMCVYAIRHGLADVAPKSQPTALSAYRRG